jgi:hypothetical protein
MSKKNHVCPLEQELLRNLESGDIKPHIASHAAECPICRETAAVYDWMNRFQQVSMEQQVQGKQLPSADAIWDGAFAAPSPLFRRKVQPDEKLVKKAMLPLVITQVLTYVIIAAGLIYLLVANLPEISRFLDTNLGTSNFFHSLLRILEKASKTSMVYLVPSALIIVSVFIFALVSDTKPEKKVLSSK